MDIACDLSGVTTKQREHHREVSAALLAARTELKRDGDRWTVVFGDGVALPLIAEFIEFERRCRAFLEFDSCVRGAGICLEIGAPNVGAALVEELFPLART